MLPIEQVSEHIWAHTHGETIGNAAFIQLRDQTVMIDSGMDPVTAQDLRITAEKTTGLPVRTLVYTHHHDDHVFGGQVFKDCNIIASNTVNTLLHKHKETIWTPEFLADAAQDNPGMDEKWNNLEITLPTTTFDSHYTVSDDSFGYDIQFPYLYVSSSEDYENYVKYFVDTPPYTTDEIIQLAGYDFDKLKESASSLSIDDVISRHKN